MRKAILAGLGLCLVAGCGLHHGGGGSYYSDSGSSSDYGASYFDSIAKSNHRDCCLETTARRYEKRGYNSDDAWAKAIRHCDGK